LPIALFTLFTCCPLDRTLDIVYRKRREGVNFCLKWTYFFLL
jgi:hypothetical protein